MVADTRVKLPNMKNIYQGGMCLALTGVPSGLGDETLPLRLSA